MKYLLPIGDLAHRLNLMSGVFGAFAVANLFLFVRLWLGKVFPAVISAVSLMLAWTFWQYSVICETYTLFAALMFCELIMLLMYDRTKEKRYLFYLAALNGLGFGNHMLAVFSLMCMLVYISVLVWRREIKVRSVLLMAMLWMVCALPIEFLFIERLIKTGDFGGTVSSLLYGDLWRNDVLNMNITPTIIAEDMVFIGMNFPTPNFLLLFAGIYFAYRTKCSKVIVSTLSALLFLYFVFAFRYTIPYRFSFFIPFYCITAILIGAGANWITENRDSKALVISILLFSLLPIPTYIAAPEIARKYYPALGQRRQRPYRDEYTFFLRPWKNGYRGAERFAVEALEVAQPGSILYSDSTCVHPILYKQIKDGLGADVMVISNCDWSEGAPVLNEETVAKYMNESAVYVVSPIKTYCPGFMLEKYDFEQVWPLYKVVEKKF